MTGSFTGRLEDGPATPPRWTRYVALGDSFTEGLMDVTDASGRHRGWADRLAERLATLDPDFRYANLAIRGRTTPQVVAEQVPEALLLRPDLVSLAVGINDTLRPRYDPHAAATHVENATRSLRSQGADVILFAFGDPSRKSRVMGRVTDRIVAANAATRAIGHRYGCFVVDFWGCAAFDADEFWDEDRLHLSPQGHELASLAVLEALGVGDDAWRTPVPEAPRGFAERLAGDVRWASRHLAPWVARRIRRRSSGDGISPKRPTLGPVPGMHDAGASPTL
ncbi:MAG: SGNH/GDSL hydrolase family protein [bacterium]